MRPPSLQTTMAKGRRLRAAIFEKLAILAARDFQVEALSAYQYRINRIIDISPVNRRWHDIRTGERGTYQELVSFIQHYDMTNQYNDQELAAASGESAYRAARALELNEVSINGDADAVEVDGKLERKGGYFRKRILVGKPKDQKPEEVNLGRTARLVFLKIRRKLVERAQKGEIICSTTSTTTSATP